MRIGKRGEKEQYALGSGLKEKKQNLRKIDCGRMLWRCTGRKIVEGRSISFLLCRRRGALPSIIPAMRTLSGGGVRPDDLILWFGLSIRCNCSYTLTGKEKWVSTPGRPGDDGLRSRKIQ